MKRTYNKPGIYVENFALSQSIATACGAAQDSTLGKPTYSDITSCGWKVGNDTYWTSSTTCTKVRDADYVIGKACYNNPSPNTAVFSYS